MRLPSKIPTIVGIFLVVLVVGSLIAGTESIFRVATTASGSIEPADVTVANVTDTTFTVSWTTELIATGALSISGPKMQAQILFDDQDVGAGSDKKTLEKRLTHHVTFRNGQPNTDYSVTILSNSKKHLDDGKPFVITTGQVITSSSGNLEPAYGTIVTDGNRPIPGALVYLTIEGGQILSTFTKPSGTWLIPLNLVRTTDLTSFLPATERMTETILVRAENLETNAASDTLNDSPVPDMSPGKTYDFRKLNAKAPGAPIALIPTPQPTSAASAILGTSSAKPANIVALTIPAQDAALPTTLPLIQGTGIPGKTVSIVLGITNPIGGSAVVGADGLWSFTPKKPLAAGRQSVTITSPDKNNKPVAIVHTFEILKSGTQVLGDATPSATIAPTATPTATLAATESATPEESTLAAQEVPTSGYELPTIILLILGIGLMFGGGIAFMK